MSVKLKESFEKIREEILKKNHCVDYNDLCMLYTVFPSIKQDLIFCSCPV